jgi:hypothetical protein
MMKEFDKAVTYYEKSLEIKYMSDSIDAAEIAQTCYNLRVLYFETHDNKNAAQYLLGAYDYYKQSTSDEDKKNILAIQQYIDQIDRNQKIEKYKNN